MKRLALCVMAAVLLASGCALAGPLARIYVVPGDVGLAPGARQQFQVMGEDADGNPVSAGPVTWTASPGIGSINSSGLFTAATDPALGHVSARVGTLYASAQVEVFLNRIRNGYVVERRIGSRSGGRFDAPVAVAAGPHGRWVVSKTTQTLNRLECWGDQNAGRFPLAEPVGDLVSVAVDDSGCIYILDSASGRIQKYNSSGGFIRAWGGTGSSEGLFSQPSQLAIDSVAGEIYVADTGNWRIQVFSTDGDYLRSWKVNSLWGYTMQPMGIQLDGSSPRRVCVAADDNDYYRGTFLRFSGTGQLISEKNIHWGGPGKFVYAGVAPAGDGPTIDVLYALADNCVVRMESDSWGNLDATRVTGGFGHEAGMFDGACDIAAYGGLVYVADRNNCRVQELDAHDQSLRWNYAAAGCLPGEFKYPSSLAVDGLGNVYVGDAGNYRVQQFGPDGAFVREIASKRAKDTAYACPGGLCTDPQNNVYITDPIGMRVLRYNSAGNLTAEWPLSIPPEWPGTWAAPMGIARLSGGYFYVTDGDGDFIATLEPTGSFGALWAYGGSGNGELNTPAGIAVGPGNCDYVADYGNNRVQKFQYGGFQIKWGTPGSGDGQFSGPAGIAVDASGSVYVADSGNHRIQKFDANGVFLGKMGSQGCGPSNLLFPGGVAVDAQSIIYVADTHNHRLVRYAPATANTVRDARLASDGTSVALTGQVVTAAHDGFFYIENDSRTVGMRVEKSSHGLQPGQRANVWGTMMTNSEGERYISASSSVVAGSGSVEPLMMAIRSLGGSDWYCESGVAAGQSGVAGAEGLNNIGLLVRVSGRVTYSDWDFFYIDDGSNVQDGSGWPGVKVLLVGGFPPEQGRYVQVTGVSSCWKVEDQVQRLVIARTADDVIPR